MRFFAAARLSERRPGAVEGSRPDFNANSITESQPTPMHSNSTTS